MSDQTLREQQAEILERMAAFLGELVPMAKIHNGDQPHWEAERLSEKDALEAGAAALRAPVRPQENEDQARYAQPQPNSGADPRGERHYWTAAIGLVADELEKLRSEHLDERRPKMIAILRNAGARL